MTTEDAIREIEGFRVNDAEIDAINDAWLRLNGVHLINGVLPIRNSEQ